MFIRKCKRKLALCIAALFWTACDNDSSTESDESVSPTESSSETTSTKESSSSNSPENPYILAIHPTVHCKDSTIFQKATCKNATVPKNSSDIKFAALYGTPCIAEDRNTPIFKCENGSMFPNNKAFSLVGDTIVQFNDFCGEWMRADECIAKKAEEAEANPETPYKLASDTTINCKQTFKPILSKLEPILTGFQSEYLISEGCFKCDDGNIYERDDMLKDEKGNLWKKEN
jgi:hypothetical protein